ncbi:glycosyltransferase family 87 protein [Methylobacterium sp. J-077]|uniref:glycosyltransferase family 87 protein n=1 Tax=Methylobacterium sp. J-077 TaxID=2836656 RepID=UPI001FB948FB|nr:glycosyltransferase family 87 protein [Methylobacterium sp. J-077]MCJ2125673.1 DUF2029 domain-containing protein [Methylobacterium sp. J-077]
MPTPPSSRTQIRIIATGFLISLATWLSLRPRDFHAWMIGAPLGHDYVNFWLAPRLVMAGQAGTLIDLPAYGEAVKAAFGLIHDPHLLFVYPPHALLFLLPLACLPFLPAVLAWTALNLGALAWATRRSCRAADRTLVLLACLSPPAVAMMLYGHFGGLLALGATVVLQESDRRPWLAGLCFAGLTVKPQFAAALGLILLCGGFWRCLFAAGIATAALVGVSVAAFGVVLWERFITVTMPLQSAFITEFHAQVIETSVAPYFVARFWGLPASVAWAIQGCVSVLALAAAVRALRGDMRSPARLLVVLLAVLVMQPYASHYDLAVVAPALTLVVLARDPRPSRLAVAVWLLVPLARIFFIFEMPLLCLLVPGALFAQAALLSRPGRRSVPAAASARLEPAV